MAQNLLVIDWDYFWPNPMNSSLPKERDFMLYDFASGETENHNEAFGGFLWITRAASFLQWTGKLPMCEGFEDFWERFPGVTEDTPMSYADSNAASGPEFLLPPDGGHWDRIDLYDAHHDSGYKEQSHVHCGNWMLAHQDRGTEQLFVHYPAWRGTVDNGCEKPPIKRSLTKRRIDPGGQVDIAYDHVLVCRSGAWVPPWCDPQFMRFLLLSPCQYQYEMQDISPREFDEAAARQQALIQQISFEDPDGMDRLRKVLASDAPQEEKDAVLAAMARTVAERTGQANQ